MYLAVQRVRAPGDRVGVNVFVYRHHTGFVPDRGVDVAASVSSNPGRMALAVTQVSGGENVVLSYLDVLAPEGVPRPALLGMLNLAVASFPSTGGRTSWWADHLGLCFDAVPSLYSPAELWRLKNELHVTLALRPDLLSARAPERASPLRAVIHADSFGIRIELTPEDRKRLQTYRPHAPLPAAIRVPHATAHAFADAIGDPFVEYAQLLTGVGMDQIDALGGIVFLEGTSGAARWDSRSRPA